MFEPISQTEDKKQPLQDSYNNKFQMEIDIKKNKKLKTIGRIFSDCLKKSSVRGVPRIYTAKSKLIKCLWTISVIILFLMLFYNIQKLVQDYLRAGTIITIKPWKPTPPFPSFTICNLNALSSSHLAKVKYTPEQFRNRIVQMAKQNNLSDSVIMNELIQQRVYHDHLNASILFDYTDTDSLILNGSCTITSVIGGIINIRDCADLHFTYVPGYSHCNTVHIKQAKGETILRVSLNILLPTTPGVVDCWYCMWERPETLRTGLQLYLHSRDIYPINIDNGLLLVPGTQNIIHVKQKLRQSVRKCNSDPRPPMKFTLGKRKETSGYDKTLCQILQHQERYQEECFCTSETLPQLIKHGNKYEEKKLHNCYKQDLDNGIFNTTFLECILDVDGKHESKYTKHKNKFSKEKGIEHDKKHNKEECPSICEKIDYSVAHSSSRGASKSSALTIYENYIRNAVLSNGTRQLLEPYERALHYKLNGNKSMAEQIIFNTHYIEQHFFTLMLMYSPKHANVYDENWIVSNSAFISQLGGALCLFSGITFICFAEILELIVDILCFYRHTGCRKAETD